MLVERGDAMNELELKLGLIELSPEERLYKNPNAFNIICTCNYYYIKLVRFWMGIHYYNNISFQFCGKPIFWMLMLDDSLIYFSVLKIKSDHLLSLGNRCLRQVKVAKIYWLLMPAVVYCLYNIGDLWNFALYIRP